MPNEHILSAAKKGVEPYQQVYAMERAAGYDRAKLGDALWTGFRTGTFDALAAPAFWRPMAETPDSYTADDVVALVRALASATSATRRDWVGAIDGWDPALDTMVDARPDALVALSTEVLPEPVLGGLTLARARRGLIPPEEVPDALLRRVALAAARGWGVMDASVVGLERVWPADRLGAAVISAALEDPSRIVQISEVLKHGAHATPLQLLQLALARTSDNELIAWFPRIVEGAAEVEAEALAAAGRALKKPSYEQRGLPNAAVLLVLDRMAESRGAILDSRFDPLIPEPLQRFGDIDALVLRLRALLARLPLERRAAVIVLIDRYPAWPYVDLAPTPAVVAVCAQAIGRLSRTATLDRHHTAAFAALGADGARALLAALDKPDPEREQSHLMLELLAEAPLAEAIPALVSATGDGKETMRQAARTALSRFTQTDLNQPVLDALEAALSSRKKAARVGAALTLAALPRTPALGILADHALPSCRDEEVAAALRPLALTPVAAGQEAWTALAPRKLTPTCRAFARALEDWSEEWREQLGLPPEDLLAGTVLWLEGHLASAYSFYRWDRVLGVLERLKGTPLLAVAPWALASVLGDCGRERVSEGYTSQYGAAFGEAAVAPVLRALASPPQQRAPLYDWLLSQHPDALPEPVLDVFLKALGDPSAAVRRLAVRGVSRSGAGSLVRLGALLASGNQEARLGAVAAISAIGGPDAAALLERSKDGVKPGKVREALDAAYRALQPVAPADPGPQGEDLAAELAALRPSRLPKMLDLSTLPPVRTLEGAPLPPDALAGLLGGLVKESAEHHDPSLSGITARLNAADLGALDEALREQGRARAAKTDEKWLLYQQALTATEARIDALAADLDDLARGGRHALAGHIIEILRRNASPAAIRGVDHWARKARSAGLRARALAARQAMAAQLGVGEDELAEIVLPGYGFDGRGQQSIAWGARTLRLELSWSGEVSVYDETGKVVASLPKPRKDEDAAQIQAARTRVTALKKAVKAASQDQLSRLEDAMITGRGWTPARFRALFLHHPLSYQAARRILFRGRGADGQMTLFFVTEEGEPTGLELNSINIESFMVITIPHPAALSPEHRAAWTALFAEAALDQPFTQLQREVSVYSSDRDPLTALIKASPTRPPEAIAYGLRNRGWDPDHAEDAGMIYGASRRFGGGWHVHVSHDGHFAAPGAFTLGDIGIRDVGFYLNRESQALDAVPARIYSEVTRDLKAVLGA